MLFHNNYILQEIDKKAFIEQEDFAYEMRFNENFGLIEATYKTAKGKCYDNFLREGLRPTKT